MPCQLTRRSFASLVAKAGALGTVPAALRALAQTPPTRPNIVFFLIDDLGWRDVGCYGSRFYETPAVDRLAAMGMRFTDGYAACTVCSPTRASILTGKYPARLHLTDWIAGHNRPKAKLRIPQWTQYLPHEEVTLAEALKAAGYTTGFIGKWHLGPQGFWPDSQGFDVNIGGDHRGQPPSYFAPYRIPTMPEGPEGEYLTDRHAADAEAFIDANAGKPFFLYVSTYAVHTPLQAKPALTEKYRAKAEGMKDYPQNHPVYGGMVQGMDECVGRVLRKLEARGLLANTAVFFTGDNGGLIGNPNRPVTSNVPLRAGKGSSYEGGVREPFIVYWPGVTPPGSTCSEPAISVDFYPTILEMAGASGDPAHNRNVDGVSLVPLLRGGQHLKRDAIYWHYPHYHPGGATPYGAVRAGDVKLIEFFEDDRVEMYDLRQDIGETADLAQTMPGKAAELRERLHAWRQHLNAQMPTPNPDYAPDTDRRLADTPPSPRRDAAHPDFAVVRDATIEKTTDGYVLSAAGEGTALKELPRPVTGTATFTVHLRTRLKRQDGWQNGFLAFADSPVRDEDLLVCGLYIGRLSVAAFHGLSARAAGQVSKSAQYEREAEHLLTVTIDLGARTVAVTCAGVTVTREVPVAMKAVRYAGYHLMQTKTTFSEIESR